MWEYERLYFLNAYLKPLKVIYRFLFLSNLSCFKTAKRMHVSMCFFIIWINGDVGQHSYLMKIAGSLLLAECGGSHQVIWSRMRWVDSASFAKGLSNNDHISKQGCHINLAWVFYILVDWVWVCTSLSTPL